MIKLFLNIRADKTLIEDYEGADFSDLPAAREEAVEAAREILADRIGAGKAPDGQIIEIRNEQNELLASIPFRDTFA